MMKTFTRLLFLLGFPAFGKQFQAALIGSSLDSGLGSENKPSVLFPTLSLSPFYLFSMKNFTRICLMAGLFFFVQGKMMAQVVTTVTAPAGVLPAGVFSGSPYSSLALAIAALNNVTTVGGGTITLTCAAGTETTPVGGYSVTFTATTSATDNVVITGAGVTLTAFTPQAVGIKNDAFFKIIGCDFVTIQGFTMNENAANTTAAVATNNMTEWGVGLFASSTTNGAQNNIIQNNTINLSNATTKYQNAIGVFSSTASSVSNGAQAAASIAGTNSNNKFYGNTITGVAQGVYFISPAQTATVFESGNEVGGSSAPTGNNITYGYTNTAGDLGYTSYSGTTPAGIYFRNVVGNSARFNTIANASGLTLVTGGIFSATGTNPTGITYTSTFSNNTITLTIGGTNAITGIDFGSGLSTGTIVCSNNNITLNQTATAANSAAVIGIKANYTSATNTCSSNTIVLNQSETTGALSSTTTAMTLAGTSTTITANSNNITVNQTGSGTGTITGTINGLSVAGTATTINTLSNTIVVNQTTSVASGVSTAINGIIATGVATTLNVGSVGNGNTITIKQAVTGAGTYAGGAITYVNAAANHATANVVGNTFNTTASNIRSTGTMTVVSCEATVSALYNIKSNVADISRLSTTGNVFFTAQTTSPSNVADTVSLNTITFSNLATSGTVTAISQLGGPSSSAPKNINNNTISITGTNSGTTKGIEWGYSAGAKVSNNNITISCAAPTVIGIDGTSTSAGGNGGINTNTISLTSSTTSPTSMIGITGGGLGVGPYQIANNIFSALNFTGVISASPVVTGVAIGVGTGNNINNNVINNITVGAATSTANPTVSGILISGGVSTNVFKNKIYGLTSNCTGATGVVNGIRISGGTTNNVYNNLIGILTAAAATNTDAVRGISITSTTTSSTHNIYYNTVYLSGAGGTNFGSSGIFHTTSITATTSTLNLRNNIIANATTPNGTGLAVAFRRSSGAANTLANYASTSNNNLFYAGTPGASNLIYSDGTSTAQTIADYKTGVFTAGTIAPRDAASVTENPVFLSTVGSSSNFLHLDGASPSVTESGGSPIATFTDDYDGDTRNATTPDIGADEYTGTVLGCVAAVGGTITPATATRCAGTTYTMTSTGASSGAGITYQWEVSTTSGSGFADVTGGSGATTTSYITGALTAGTFYYRLKVTCSNGPITNYSNELTLTVNAAPTVAVTPTTGTFCSPGGTPVALTASGADTYAWSPASGLSGTTGANVTASPSSSTTYTVTGTTTATGCTNTATSVITVNSAVTMNSVTATPSTVCSGDNSTLLGNASINASPTLGSGTSVTTASTTGSTLGPNPMQSYYGGSKQQIIVLASELTSLGMASGSVISALKFNMNAVEARTLQSYVVKIQNTALTAFASTSFVIGGFTTVRNAANLTPVAGLNTITFDTPFTWDGSSNLLIETNTSNNDGGGTGTNTAIYSTTAFASTLFYRVDNNTPAAVDAATTASFAAYTQRDNITFTFSTPISSSNYVWSVLSGPGGVSSTTTNPTTATGLTATTQYQVVGTNAGCSATGTVTVTVSPGAAITGQPSPLTRCAGQTATFTVVATGPGLMYQWRKGGVNIPIGGNASAGTATLSLTGVTAADADTYDVEVSSSCGSPVFSNTALLTVNALPTVAVTPTTGTFCTPGGTPVALAASGADTYAWSPSTGLSGTTGANVTASPTVTTTYTVTGTTTATGCTNTATAVITSTPTPILSAATATPATICSGANSQLLATVSSTPNTYAFSASTSTFTPLTGATVITGGNADTYFSGALPIGFSFNYNGTAYSNFYFSSNGFISFTATIGSATTNALATASSPVVAPLWDDLDGATAGTASYLTSGSPGSRVLTVEWLNWEWNWSTNAATISFQAKIYEADGHIEFVYRQDAAALISPSASIGVTGAVGNYLSLNNTTASPTASSTTETTTLSVKPATDQMYVFTAPTFTYSWTPTTFIPPGQEVISNPLATAVTATTTYNVTATRNGCTSTPSTVTVTVSPGAAITTQPSPLTRCAGQTATFTVVATGPGLTYQWRKGGVDIPIGGNASAGTATLTLSSVTAADADNYDVVVSSTCGSPVTSTPVALIVNALPTVAVTPTTGSICNPGGTPIALAASGATTYAWSPASGLSAATGANVTASPLATTTYTVTGTDGNGCTNTATAAITVNVAISATASATPTEVCSGLNSQLDVAVAALANVIKITEVTINRLGTGATSPYPAFVVGADLVEVSNISSLPVNISGWTLADFASNATTPTHTALTFPTGTIIPANSVAVVCLGTGTNDTANRYFNTGGTSDFWLSGSLIGIVLKNGSTVIDAVGLNSGYVFNAATGVTAGDWSGFAPSASGFAGTTRTAAVDVNTGADWTQSSVGTPQTMGTYNGGFTNPVSIASYAWTPATFLNDATIANPLATAVTTTTAYNVVVTTTAGCTASSNITVTVVTGAAITTHPSLQAKCAGATATFSVVATGPGLTYQWRKDGGNLMDGGTISGSSTATLTITGVVDPTDEGNYDVIVTATCGSPVTSSAAALTVETTIPTATITPSATFVCGSGSVILTASGAGGGGSYAWAANPTLSATNIAAPTATPLATTTYTVTVTNAGGCSASTSQIINFFTTPVITVSPATATINCGVTQAISVSENGLASNYNFTATAPASAFVPLTGSTAVDIIEDDDVVSSAIPIGFNFVFENTTYTNVIASSNGWLSFNPSATSSNPANSASPSTAILPLLAPLWDDLDGLSVGDASYLVTGTAPNRVFTFEWLNWEWFYQADAAVISFQVKLYETTNRVEYIYRQDAAPISLTGIGTPGATIGIIKTSANYKVLDGTGGSPTASNSIFTTNLLTKPATDQVYRFDPPASTYLWSPTTNLFTDMAATVPYVAQNVATVYAKPTTTTTYSVTATNASGCTSSGSSAITVNLTGTSGTISGTSTLCAGGATTTLTSSGDAGGTWTSGTPAVASVNPTTGVVTPLTVGMSIISYQATCAPTPATFTVTVVGPANAGTISGTNSLCVGGPTTTLTSSGNAGGTWTSGTPAVATINPTTGLVTPLTAGTTSITYAVTNACGPVTSAGFTVTVSNCAIALQSKVFLSHASGGVMDDYLRQIQVVPLNDPYADAALPYDDGGNFTFVPSGQMATTTQTILDDNLVVDWIFVELRSGDLDVDGFTTVVASKSGLLKNDGTVINPNGTPFSFSGVAAGNYYVAIKHRNHEGFMTATKKAVPTPSLLDFTDGSVTFYEPSYPALKEVVMGVFAMWTGDATLDLLVDGGDVNYIRSLSGAIVDEYHQADVNLDGQVDGGDVNAARANSGSAAQQID
jgi:hypothetical protein